MDKKENNLVLPYEPIKHNSVRDQLVERIKEAILQGVFAPGEPLPTERRLCELFGVGRTTVREALRTLEAQGLLSSSKGSPTTRTVTIPGIAGPLRDGLVNLLRLRKVDPSDLLELRSAVESSALQLAANHHKSSKLMEALDALEKMSVESLSIEEYYKEDMRFHLALIAASGNMAMYNVMVAIREAMAEDLLDFLIHQPQPREVLKQFTREHEGILHAVQQGKGLLAARLLQAHIQDYRFPKKNSHETEME